MPENIINIPSIYRGPDGIVNGGYVAGILAGRNKTPVEVTLKKPAPPDTDLTIESLGKHNAVLIQGDMIIAEAKATCFELDVPPPPAFAEAESASGNYSGFNYHPAPNCFVCGPNRRDGFRIFPGKLAKRNYVAAPWVPHKKLADKDGCVKTEFIWAVLDCPGAVAIEKGKLPDVMLGRLALRLITEVLPENQYIVIGWSISSEGRKYFTGTALYSAAGELCACAKATWIRTP